MIVVDASVLVNALADDGSDGDRARLRLAAQRVLAAPHLVDLEVASVVRRHTARGDLSPRRADLALRDLVDLPLDRHPHHPLIGRIWQFRHALTAYDAAYLALAEVLDCALLTADARLAAGAGNVSTTRVEVLA